jgi:hypothetical protein
MTSRFIWLSLALLAGVSVSAMGQTSTKTVYLRGMFRDGKRVFFAVESAELKTIRRYQLASTARIRLYLPRPPYGKYEPRYVTVRRFTDLFSGKDKRAPQPLTLKSPFTMTVRAAKIVSLAQIQR